MPTTLRNLALSLVALLCACQPDQPLPPNAQPGVETVKPIYTPDTLVVLIGRLTRGKAITRDHGFEIANDSLFTQELQTVSLGRIERDGEFSHFIEEPESAAQVKYFRAYLRHEGERLYGEGLPFVQGPLTQIRIDAIRPEKAFRGDTIVIEGTGLQQPLIGDTEVTIGGVRATVLEASASRIRCVLPISADGDFEVEVRLGSATSFFFPYQLVQPAITRLSPASVGFSQPLTLIGQDLDDDPRFCEVHIGGQIAEVLQISNDSITVQTPRTFAQENGNVRIELENKGYTVETLAPIQLPAINDMRSDKIEDQTYIIEGEHFHPIPEDNQIIIQGREALVLEGNTRQLKVRLQARSTFPNRQATITLSIPNLPTITEEVAVQAQWLPVSTLPFNYSTASSSRSTPHGVALIGNQAFVVGREFNTRELRLCRYDPSTASWNISPNQLFQGTSMAGRAIFPNRSFISQLNGFLFAYTMYWENGSLVNDWRVFLPSTNQWFERPSLSNPIRPSPTFFSLDGSIYVGMGELADPENRKFYAYNSSNFWQPVPDIPLPASNEPLSSQTTFTHGASAYVLIDQQPINAAFYRFDPAQNQWTALSGPMSQGQYHGAFTLGGKAYVLQGANQIWEYDPATNSWTQLGSASDLSVEGSFVFSLNGKGYIGLPFGYLLEFVP